MIMLASKEFFMALNIDGSNFVKNEIKENSPSINILNKTLDNTAGVKDTFAAVVVSKGEKKISSSYDDLLKEADDVKSQIMQSATDAKIGLNALMKKLSGSEAVELGEDGYNLTDSSKEEMLSIIDKIRVELSMHCKNYRAYGNGVSKEAIENATGSKVLANKIEDKLQGLGVQLEEEDLNTIQENLNKLDKLEELSSSAKLYIVENNLSASIKDLYTAEFATSTSANRQSQISEADLDSMKPQLVRLVQESGCDDLSAAFENAKTLLRSDIAVTSENLEKLEALDSLNISDMKSMLGKASVIDKMLENKLISRDLGEIDLTSKSSKLETVAESFEVVNDASYSEVESLLSRNRELTIENLKQEISRNSYIDTEPEDNYEKDLEVLADFQLEDEIDFRTNETNKAYVTLLETRILMSVSARSFLINNAAKIMTTPISKLNEELYKNVTTASNNILATDLDRESLTSLVETEMALEEIKESPIYIFNKMLNTNSQIQTMTLSYTASLAGQLKKSFDRYNNTVETVGTQIRADLGDSIVKAVNNSAESLMDSLGLDYNQANKDAIRILALNGMEETKENVDKIKEVNETLKNLINNMKPETVLKMIREGINPMDADINDLNKFLILENDGASLLNEEKFSKFLYKLDQTDNITKSERKMFIGIYQMMNIFTRDAGESVGRLIKQGSSVTMSNLMTAYESRKHAGIDELISEDTGLAEVSGEVNYYTSLFMNSEKLITPNTLKKVDDKYGILSEGVEDFVNDLNSEYDPELERQLDYRYVRELTDATNLEDGSAEDRLYEELKENDMAVNIGNIKAVSEFMQSSNISLATYENYKFDKNNKIDNLENVIEKIGHEPDLSNYISELVDASKEELEALIEGRLTDINNPIDASDSMRNLAEDSTIDDLDYQLFDMYRKSTRQFNYIANRAKERDYKIPYMTEEGLGIMNVSLVSEEEVSSLAIKLNSKTYGCSELNLEVNDLSVNLSLSIENSDRALETLKSDLEAVLRNQHGFTEVTFNEIFQNENRKKATQIPTESLYEIARDMVTVMV